MTSEPSDTLREGRFVVLATLGEGAQGRTFDCVDKREGRPVAIKELDVRGARAWKDVELAEREARVLKSLDHRKLPRYVDHFEENGKLYLVMEKIEGESLSSLRKRGATLSERQVLAFLRDAAEVLDYLHGRAPPVFHRDLKPGNVILRPDGSFAFVDFGAVRERLRPAGGSTIVGTFGFMAPEQFQGRALPGSDVYAIGATALSLLTGSEPEDLPHRGLAIDVRAALGGRNDRLASVLAKMLDPDPDTRASRIGPLLAALDARAPSRPEMKTSESRAYAPRANRHTRRSEARQARREEKAMRHAERRARRRSARGPVPWPIALAFTLALSLGIVAVTLATQVILPILLELLALVLGLDSLRRAAARIQSGG
ncbi:MAG: serine/threonine protein kinase, partial [Polyangiaceae bacterium]